MIATTLEEQAAAAASGVPWELVGGGGAAAAVIVVVLLFLRRMTDQRKSFELALNGIADRFADRADQWSRLRARPGDGARERGLEAMMEVRKWRS